MFGSQTHPLAFDRSTISRRGGNSAKVKGAMMQRKVEQVVPYRSFRNNILTIPGYRFSEVLPTYLSPLTE